MCECVCWFRLQFPFYPLLCLLARVCECLPACVCACLSECVCVYFIQFSFQLVCNCSFVRWLAFLNSCDGISPLSLLSLLSLPSPLFITSLFHLMCSQILYVLRNQTRHSALQTNSIEIPFKIAVKSALPACSACLQGMLASYCALYITLHPFIRLSLSLSLLSLLPAVCTISVISLASLF